MNEETIFLTIFLVLNSLKLKIYTKIYKSACIIHTIVYNLIIQRGKRRDLGMSKERLNEENYAFAFGYLYGIIQNLIDQIQDEAESEDKHESYL